MASSASAAALAFLALAAAVPAALCQAPGPGPAAAAPKQQGPPNVTEILEKAQQYTTFIRLLASTQQDTQLNSQLNSSGGGNGGGNGYTVFAPTDGAFAGLKPGTLNKLSQQEQVSLVQYHVLPEFYSLDSFQTASNPVRTQASGADGPYTLNVTADSSGQANVSTGLVATRVGTPLSSKPPLAVYSVDAVLLPNDLFGVKPPAPAPAKKQPAKGGAGSGSVAEAPASGGGSADAPPSGAAAAGARAGWSSLLLLGAAACSSLL